MDTLQAMRRKMMWRRCLRRIIMAGALIVIIGAIIGGFYINYSNEASITAKVINISEQQNVIGSKDGFSTSYTYIVSTDKGMFSIQPDGLFASSAFGTLEKGKTYRFEVRGGRSDIMGIFPYIIKAEEVP